MTIGLFVLNDGTIDLKKDSLGLLADEGMETAITISLFSDKRAGSEELPPGVNEKRGWWGDTVSEVDQDKIGSKLWLLEREKILPATANRAEEYVRDALEWLIEDGVALSIDVQAGFEDKILVIKIEIVRSNGASQKYSVRWDEQELVREVE